jgi:hypothetical protein
MAQSANNVLAAGAQLVLRGWRALVWAYAALLLVGVATAFPTASAFSSILDHSMESGGLVSGFDLGVFFSLLLHPEFHFSGAFHSSLFASILYVLFMLFFTGGLLADFSSEQRLTFGKFLEACAEFFWRFVRLLLFLLLALVPLGALYALLDNWIGKLADHSVRESLGFWLTWGCWALLLLLFVILRLWFDVAQIRAVAEHEPKIRRALGQSFRIAFGSLGALYWIFLRMGIVALLGSAAAAWIFGRIIRPEQVGLTILLGQAFVLFWLTIRFWLRACETLWYQRKFSAPEVFVEAPAPPASLEIEPPPTSAPPLNTPPEDAPF